MMDGGSPPEFGSVGEYLLKRPGCNSSFKSLRATTSSKQLPQEISLTFLEMMELELGGKPSVGLDLASVTRLTDSQEIDTWTVRLSWYLGKSVRDMFNCS
jgi:hypothetical protein